jgi:hypothetical protein
MEPLEFLFDYVIHLFDFIKNAFFRTFVQIIAMTLFTAIIVAIMWGISKLIIWMVLKYK